MLGMLLSLVYPKVLLFVGNAVVSCVSYSAVVFWDTVVSYEYSRAEVCWDCCGLLCIL